MPIGSTEGNGIEVYLHHSKHNAEPQTAPRSPLQHQHQLHTQPNTTAGLTSDSLTLFFPNTSSSMLFDTCATMLLSAAVTVCVCGASLKSALSPSRPVVRRRQDGCSSKEPWMMMKASFAWKRIEGSAESGKRRKQHARAEHTMRNDQAKYSNKLRQSRVVVGHVI